MREENVEELRKLGTVVYLDLKPDEVIRRLAGDETSPLLQGDDVERKVHDLMGQRQMVYESAADQIVNVTGVDVDDIVESIISLSSMSV